MNVVPTSGRNNKKAGVWNKDFAVPCDNIYDFNMMSHEIAMEIKTTKEEGRKFVLILLWSHGHVPLDRLFLERVERGLCPCVWL